MGQNSIGTPRFDGLQCLRAIAALLVMVVHMKYAGDFSGMPWIQSAAGGVGVDIFFVISGFVITISAKNLDWDWRRFMVNRISRIAPFYWLISIPILIIGLLKGRIEALQVFNTLAFLPFLDVGTFTDPIHPAGWTLSFEFWFYLLFGALICWFGRHTLILMPVLLLVGCAWTGLMYRGEWYLPRFLFHPLTLEFGAGMVLAHLRGRLRAKTLVVCVVLAVVLGFRVIANDTIGVKEESLGSFDKGLLRALVWGGFGVCLVAATTAIDSLQLVHWPKWFVVLGDASYSIYLIQPFALFAGAVAGRVGSPLASASAYVAFVVVGGVLLSRLVELPLTKIARGGLDRVLLKRGARPHAVAV